MVCWSLQHVDTIDKSAGEFVPVPMPNPSRVTNAIATLKLPSDDYLHGRYQPGPSYIMVEHEDDLDQVVRHWDSTFVAAWDNEEIYINGERHPIVGKVPRTFIEIISQPCVKPKQRISAYNDYPAHNGNKLYIDEESPWIILPLHHPWIDHDAPDSAEFDFGPMRRKFSYYEQFMAFVRWWFM